MSVSLSPFLIALPDRSPQIRREPFFHCSDGFSSPRRVISGLIAPDLTDPEILRIGMRKIESTHTGSGMHRERLRQFDSCVVLCIKQIKERSLLGVIRTGRIPGSRTDAPIFFADEISIRQLFVAAKFPRNSSLFMQILGKRFS